jgi:hypothetical protein
MFTLSAFGGGLIALPIATFLAAIYCFIRAGRVSGAGSEIIEEKTGRVIGETGPESIFKTGAFKFGVAFIVATIGIVIAMLSEA